METTYLTKEQIALELTLAALEKFFPTIKDASPKGEGEAIAELYNSVFENLIGE